MRHENARKALAAQAGGAAVPQRKGGLALAAFCAAALAWIFGCGLDGTSAAYAVYAVSFYALVAFTGWTVRAGRRGWQRVSALPLVTWWQADACQRVRAGLALSLLVNLCYAGCKIVSAVLYTSVWEAALGIYYLLLCGVRAFLLRQMPAAGGEDRSKRGLLAYRRTGWFLLGLALALTGIAVQIVRDGRRYDYPGTLIYAAAAYAFYCLTAAIVNAVRYRQFHSPVLSAAKAVSLTTALVSIFRWRPPCWPGLAGGGVSISHDRLHRGGGLRACAGASAFHDMFRRPADAAR